MVRDDRYRCELGFRPSNAVQTFQALFHLANINLQKDNRPIFFVCHSTGGLVVKMALAEAQRSKHPILGDCYGVTFFGRSGFYGDMKSLLSNTNGVSGSNTPSRLQLFIIAGLL